MRSSRAVADAVDARRENEADAASTELGEAITQALGKGSGEGVLGATEVGDDDRREVFLGEHVVNPLR